MALNIGIAEQFTTAMQVLRQECGHNHDILRNLETDLFELCKKPVARNFITFKKTIRVISGVTRAIPQMKSNDPTVKATAMLNVINTVFTGISGIGDVPLLSGALGSVISLIAAIVPCFAPKQKTLADIIKETVGVVIKEAFKYDDINTSLDGVPMALYSRMTFLETIARNGGRVEPTLQANFKLSDCQFGLIIMDKLRYYIQKYQNAEEQKEAKRVVRFMHYYCLIASWRRFVLALQCSLLYQNEMTVSYKEVLAVATDYSDDTEVLNLKYITEKKSFITSRTRIYGYIQSNVLNNREKQLLHRYRGHIRCEPLIRRYDPTKDMTVAIWSTKHQHFWGLYRGHCHPVKAHSDTPIRNWGLFQSIPQGGNKVKKVAFNTESKKYMQIKRDNNGCGIHANGNEIKTWETFKIHPVNAKENLYGLQCDNDKFIRSSDKNTQCKANSKHLGPDETFLFMPIPTMPKYNPRGGTKGAPLKGHNHVEENPYVRTKGPPFKRNNRFGIRSDVVDEMMDDDDDDMKIDDAIVIRNGLIIGIAIGEYADKDIPDLPSVSKDMANYYKVLDQKYKYKFMTPVDMEGKRRYTMTKQDVEDYIKNECLPEFRRGVTIRGGYDGLLVAFSGHGTVDSIVCSDGKMLAYSTIRKWFQMNPVLLTIPRLYCVDACRVEASEKLKEMNKDDMKHSDDDTTPKGKFKGSAPTVTIMGESEGYSVTGGKVSEYLCKQWDAQFEENKFKDNGKYRSFGSLFNAAYREVLNKTQQKLIKTEYDLPIDKVVFVPKERNRGAENSQVDGTAPVKDDDLWTILAPQPDSKMDLLQYFFVLLNEKYTNNKALCGLSMGRLEQLGITKRFHLLELMRRVSKLWKK